MTWLWSVDMCLVQSKSGDVCCQMENKTSSWLIGWQISVFLGSFLRNVMKATMKNKADREGIGLFFTIRYNTFQKQSVQHFFKLIGWFIIGSTNWAITNHRGRFLFFGPAQPGTDRGGLQLTHLEEKVAVLLLLEEPHKRWGQGDPALLL